jgi:SMC interacting uncharacterized protein involved in chromosome segregation
MAADFETEMREHMRLNRAALYDFRQVNRTLVVAVNENVGVTRELRDDIHGMRGDIRELRDEVRGMRGDIRGLRDDIHEMRDDIHGMRSDIQEMSGMLKSLTEAVLLVLDELRGNGGPSAATT